MRGSEFVKLISGLSFAEREAALMDALGSRVDWPLVEVPVVAGRRSGIIRVTSDVLALGTCDDFVRVPTTPRTAQRIADGYLHCSNAQMSQWANDSIVSLRAAN